MTLRTVQQCIHVFHFALSSEPTIRVKRSKCSKHPLGTVDMLIIYKADCEHSSSSMNAVFIHTRNSLLLKTASYPIFLKNKRPSPQHFQPKGFIQCSTWKEIRHTDLTASRLGLTEKGKMKDHPEVEAVSNS
jgi:hypothetical protein